MSLLFQVPNLQYLIAMLITLAAGASPRAQDFVGRPAQIQACDIGTALWTPSDGGAAMKMLCLGTQVSGNIIALRIKDATSSRVAELRGSLGDIALALSVLYPRGLYLLEEEGDLDIPNALPNMPEVSEYWTDESPIGDPGDCGHNLYYVVSLFFRNPDRFKFCVKSAVRQQEIITRALRRMWDQGYQMAIRIGGGLYIIEPGAIPQQEHIEAMLRNPRFARAVYEVLVEMSRGVARNPNALQVIWSIAPWDAFR